MSDRKKQQRGRGRSRTRNKKKTRPVQSQSAPENTDRPKSRRSDEPTPGTSGLASAVSKIKKEWYSSPSKRSAESKIERPDSSYDEDDKIVYYDDEEAILHVTDDWEVAMPVIDNIMTLQKIKKDEKEKWLKMDEKEFKECHHEPVYQSMFPPDAKRFDKETVTLKKPDKKKETIKETELNLQVERKDEESLKESYDKEIVDEKNVPEEVIDHTEKVESKDDDKGDVGFEWQSDFSLFKGQKETYLRKPGPTIPSTCPYGLFTAIWNKDIMDWIVQETNRYACQMIFPITMSDGFTDATRLRYWRLTNLDEMYLFFAILIYISLDYRARLDEYWLTGVLGMPGLQSLMSRDRFFQLLKYLHFVSNNLSTHTLTFYEKKIHKVRVIVNHCNKKFMKLYIPKQHICLDESLMLWKGRARIIQAPRFGIKSYELCEGDTGYLLKTFLYAGKASTGIEEPIHGFDNQTAEVVLKLMDGYLDIGHVLAIDNLYNQLTLTRYLKSRKTDVIGTFNRRKNYVPDDIRSLEAHSMPRGKLIARHCGDINVVAWQDEKLVTMISTYHTDEIYLEQRAGEAVIKPKLVQDYKKYMGGVDLKDQRLSAYVMERRRASKWYMRVFRGLLNASIHNMYLILKANVARNSTERCYITHRQFRFAMADLLVRHHRHQLLDPTARMRSPSPRLDNHIAHVLVNTHHCHTPSSDGTNWLQRRRCVRCSAAGIVRTVTTMCARCDVGLCVGICFSDYHTLQRLRRRTLTE